MVQNYDEFCAELMRCGFSMGGGKAKGIYAIVPYDWKEQELFNSPVKWHTGDPDTDPWEWRMRVLEERRDIAYAKVFYRIGGYITKDWYPCFLAARRGGDTFSDAWQNGEISAMEKRVYELICEHGRLPSHSIRPLGGFSSEDNSKIEKALTDLQMKMFITICGQEQKRNKFGEPYGWFSTVFCTTESFWGEDMFKRAEKLSQDEAEEKIRRRVLELNPSATKKDIMKFIYG